MPFCKIFFFKYFWWYLLFCEENINYRKVEIFQETFFGSYSFIHPDSWNFLTCSHKFWKTKVWLDNWPCQCVPILLFVSLLWLGTWSWFLMSVYFFLFFLEYLLVFHSFIHRFLFAFSFLILWSPYIYIYKKKHQVTVNKHII